MSYLLVNETRLYLEREGSGPPLVLVHGLDDESGLWAPVSAGLAHRFSAVRYDLRAHGLSAGESATDVPLDTHLADLASLLDALAPGPVHLVAHDLGGLLAQSVAYASPGRVRTLVLVGTLPAPLPAPRPSHIADAATSAGYCLPAPPDPSAAAPTSSDGLRRLGAIDCHALIVVGEMDAPEYQQGAELLHGWIPNSRLVRIADAGHAPHVEQPPRFLAALRPFFDEFAPRG